MRFSPVVRRAFISSLPVMMGYLAMGFAAGVLLAAHSGISMPAVWGAITSATSISGALQFMIVDWARMQTPLMQVALLTLCLNIRYAMYGLSLIGKFKNITWWKKLYLIWSLTDETYALEVAEKESSHNDSIRYCLTLAALNHLYWIAGVTSGAVAGMALPFSDKGIDFAMTALFIVIAVGQWKGTRNHLPAAIGCLATLASLRLAGEDNMLILALVVIVAALLVFSPKMPEGQALHKAGTGKEERTL